MTKPTYRNVLVRVISLASNGYAFGQRVDTGEGVFIPNLVASKVNAQPDVTLACDITTGKDGAAVPWRAVVARPAKSRLQPIEPNSPDHVIDDRILIVMGATGRAMTAEAVAEVVFGRHGINDFYAICVNRVQDRLDYLHEMNQILCATVFRAQTPEGEEDEVYGLRDVFAGVTV